MAAKKPVSRAEGLRKEEKEIITQQSAGIKQDEQFLTRLKALFFKEAEIIADKALPWEKKCKECIKLVDEQNTILRKVRSNTGLLFKLAEKSEKVLNEESEELFLSRYSRHEGDHATGIPGSGVESEINKAKNTSSLIEKMNFLVLYDLDMLLQDQVLRRDAYEKAIKGLSAETSKKDFLRNQYDKLLRACRYLNEMLKYVLGEANLSKYEIFIEEKIQKSFR